jgi:hypothetical protein
MILTMADTHILKYGFLAALSLSAAVFLPFDGGLPNVKKPRELTDNRGSTVYR